MHLNHSWQLADQDLHQFLGSAYAVEHADQIAHYIQTYQTG